MNSDARAQFIYELFIHEDFYLAGTHRIFFIHNDQSSIHFLVIFSMQ